MRFEVGEQAAVLREAVDALLTTEATPAVVRAGWPGGDEHAVGAVWRKLAGSGAIGTLVSEDVGGLGLDENCLVPLLERLGRSGLPVPVVETIAVAAPLLSGHDRLGDVLAGAAVVAVQPAGGDLVAFGQRADLVVLRAGGTLRVHERAQLALEPVASVDGSRALARLIRPARGGRLVADDPAVVEAAWLRGVLGTAAMLVGLAGRLLDMTVAHVTTREQFGVPIGSFQAIKHALADGLLAVEFARPAVLAAGWAQATAASDAGVQISMAKVLASDAARLVARTAIQAHGAIAYTTECDLHLFAKRVWAQVPSWGDPAWHRARLATALGLSEG